MSLSLWVVGVRVRNSREADLTDEPDEPDGEVYAKENTEGDKEHQENAGVEKDFRFFEKWQHRISHARHVEVGQQ